MRMIARSGELRNRVIGRSVDREMGRTIEKRSSETENRSSRRFSNFDFPFSGFLLTRSPDHPIGKGVRDGFSA
jgi:hypothetical protein